MAAKVVASSAAFATSGGNTRVLGLILSGSHASNIGNAVIKTGGTSGTAVTNVMYVSPGQTVQIDLRGFNVIGDYLTLADATAMVTFLPDKAA